MYVLTDADVATLSPHLAVAVMREALLADSRGELLAPPRLFSSEHDEAIVLSAGALRGTCFGFRAYSQGNTHGDQVVAVFDRPTWKLDAIVVGHLLGERRTGALGAVAVDALAHPESSTVTVIGTSNQAFSQLWAIRKVRPITLVRVFSRGEQRREEFAEEVRRHLDLSVIACSTAQDAVEGAEIVILSTSSNSPVIDSSWVSPGAHITTMGRKTVRAHECPIDLVKRASVVATDSVTQLDNFGGEPISSAAGKTAVALSTLVAATSSPGVVSTSSSQAARVASGEGDVTVFISAGLGGTEALLARRWIDSMSPDERARLCEVTW